MSVLSGRLPVPFFSALVLVKKKKRRFLQVCWVVFWEEGSLERMGKSALDFWRPFKTDQKGHP